MLGRWPQSPLGCSEPGLPPGMASPGGHLHLWPLVLTLNLMSKLPRRAQALSLLTLLLVTPPALWPLLDPSFVHCPVSYPLVAPESQRFMEPDMFRVSLEP